MLCESRPKNATRSSVFCRESLPSAASFYASELGKLSRSSRDWSIGRCCFHRPDRRPSLSVNVKNGAFVCFACGSKGGSLIDFVMLRDSCDFKTAARSLGAWRDQGLSESERSHLAEQRRERQRQKQVAVDLAQAEHELRMRYRHEIHTLETVRRDATARLGNSETWSEEVERSWDLLALIQDELRECLATYYLLSFGTCAERQEFIENPEWRDRAVRGVLDRGLVRDDRGHMTEVTFS